MAHVSRYDVALTGSTDGFTGYTGVANGLINAIDISTSGTLSSTASITITGEVTNHGILAVTVASISTGGPLSPHYGVVDTTGGAITNAHGEIGIADERLKVVVGATTASGLSGTLRIYVEGA